VNLSSLELILKKTATKQTNAKAKQVLMGFGVDPV